MLKLYFIRPIWVAVNFIINDSESCFDVMLFSLLPEVFIPSGFHSCQECLVSSDYTQKLPLCSEAITHPHFITHYY